MSIVRNKKALLTTMVVLLVSCLLAVALFVNFKYLENVQNEALEELDRRIGEYDERSIVLYGTSKAKASKLAERFGAELRITSNGRFATLTLPEGTTIREIFADKENRRYIDDMSADYQVNISELYGEETVSDGRLPARPQCTFTDNLFESQRYLDYLNLRNVWEQGISGSGVTVAVIDTGIDTDHPEFAGKISEYSYNATEDKIVKDYVLENGSYAWSLIEDEQGHGTGVAGVIASGVNNGGIIGLAPDAELIVIKAECDELGRFKRTSDLVFGLYYAIERDADVVNMSFGTYGDNPFEEAAQLAYDSDVICVAAAGNDATADLCYPAADKNVIGVGALDGNSWILAEYSNYGENTNIVAPGSTYTAIKGGTYGNMTGTSLASPVVAGSIALYMNGNPYLTFDQVTEALYISGYDLGDKGRDWYYGFGALDIYTFICGERGTITYDMLTDELDNEEGLFVRGHTLQELPEPERLYAVFDGWYYDDTFTQEYNYYEDKFYGDLTLYAKWVNEDDGVPYTYVELDDGTIEIRSYTGKRKYITIPEKIDGKAVSSIGDFAFKGESKLREIVLPSGLTHIGLNAFDGCSNLMRIYVPESVTEIEECAFKNNVRLSTVAFTGNSKLRVIGALAFQNCSSLRTFEVPSYVEVLDGSAFFGCSSLTRITVGAGNRYFSHVDGVLYNYTGNTLVAYPAAKGNEFTVPESVTVIGDYAFGFSKLKTIDLAGVENIGAYAFANSSLETLNIPDTVLFAGKYSFLNNYSLTDITIGRGLYGIEAFMFAGNTSLKSITIPNTLAAIGGCAFKQCVSLTTVEFEENSSLFMIGSTAFFGCSLGEIDIPASVVDLGDGVFYANPLTRVSFGKNSSLRSLGAEAFIYCSSLTEITLPEGLEIIGGKAFAFSGLKGITVPKSVTDLGYGAFMGCYGITDVEIASGNTVYHDIDGVVYTLDNTAIHTYPSGKEAFEYTVNNTVKNVLPYAFGYTFAAAVNLPDQLVQISEYAFYYSGLYSLNIPDPVMQIGRYAFAGSSALQEIYFTENAVIPRISYGAFAYSGLYRFTVPASVSTMAQGAFEGCENLYTVTFAENSKLESISAYMFDGCSNLGEIIFLPGSALTSVQAHGLEGMSRLHRVDFGGAAVTNIDNFAFRFCNSLSEINLPKTVESIGRYAFYGCESLSEISFPENLEHIGSYAFLGTKDIELYFASESLPLYLDENWDHGIRGYYTGVTKVVEQGSYKYAVLSSGNIAIIEYLGNETEIDLTKTDFGGKITVIGGSAFKDSSITSVILPETLTSIQAEAFAYTDITSVNIPASVTFIGREAFAYTNIETLTFEQGSKLKVIEQYAFCNTEALGGVTLPASLTAMGTGAFMQSGITTLAFEQGSVITEIPQKAFAETKITALSLPDSVVLVNHNAFNNVQTLKSVSFGNNDGIRLMSNAFYHTGLEKLHIPANVTYIGEYCFVALSNLTEFTVDANNPNYTAVDGLLLSKNGRKLISVPAGREGVLTVPLSVEEIGFGAFEESKLTQVLFNKDANVLSLGYRAFFKSAITEITVPKSVVAIDYYAFAYCENLTTVIFEEGSNLKGIYEGAFCGDINLENIIIPDSIVEISDFAFYGCSKIDSLPISGSNAIKGIYDYSFAYTGLQGEFKAPETLIDIGAYAFLGCDLTKVTVPDTNKQELIIGIGAFEECNKLEEIALPFIGASFEDMDITWLGYIFGAGKGEANKTYVPQSLKKVTLSEGVTTLGAHAFYQIETLEEINVPETVSVVAVNAFSDTVAKYELKNTITFVDYDWMGNVYYWDYIQTDFIGKGLSGTLRIDEGIKTINLYDFPYLEEIVLPDSVKELNVNKLSALRNVKLQDGLERIELFDCESVENVILPDSVVMFSFTYCTNLKTVKLPKEITEIPGGAFGECYSLESIDIPDTVTKIGTNAFSHCRKLKNIDIPAGVTEIGPWAFSGCEYLTKVVIPEGVKTIEEYAFEGCARLFDITLPRALEKIGSYAFLNSGILEIKIPNTVSIISANAFQGCGKLTNITLSENTEYIGESAFEECRNLYEIVNNSNIVLEFGSSDHGFLAEYAQKIVEKDGTVRFREGAVDRETIVTPEGFKFTKEEDSYTLIAYEGTESTITLPSNINGNSYTIYNFRGGENIIIPPEAKVTPWAFADNVTIKSVVFLDGYSFDGEMAYAFYQCASLERAVLPEGMEILWHSIFEKCRSLKEVVVPSTVSVINQGAFYDCESLERITLPESLTHIYYEAFAGSGLKEIYIPKNVVSIQGNVFSNTPIEKIEISPENASFTGIDGVIYSKDITTVVYVPDSVKEITIPATVTNLNQAFARKANLETVDFQDGSKLTAVEYNDFISCENLKNITLPAGVTYIGTQAFHQCENLEYVFLPEGLTRIEYGAFSYCNSLKTINIPNTVTDILPYAFENCKNFESLHIPASVEYIGDSCFYDCKLLEITVDKDSKHYVIENGVLYSKDMTSILWVSYAEPLEITVPETVELAPRTFSYHKNIIKVTLPEGITEIRENMFEGCSGLTEVALPSTVKKISDFAFYGCYSLKEISFPEGLEEIGQRAFVDCRSLLTISLPSSLKKIGTGAFGYGYLTIVDLPEGLEEIGDYAFQSGYALLQITIPSTVKYISDSAFEDCTSLEIINHSDCDIDFSNSGKHAKAIVDKNGNKTYREDVEDYEIIITDDGFVFTKETGGYLGEYVLKAYIGGEDTVTLPADINGNKYALHLFNGAKNVIIPDSWTEIPDGAFSNLLFESNMLESVKIPESVTRIGGSAFSNCVNLKSVVIPDSVEQIVGYAFYNCSSLKEIVIPDSVTQMENNVFEGCTNLEKVVYSSNIEWLWADTLKDTAYYNNPANWENGCLYVGNNLIKVDENAEFVEIDKNTSIIAEGAFDGCFSIKTISTSYFRYGTFAQATNVETLMLSGYTTITNLQGAFGNVIPVTLKNIVLTSDFRFIPDNYLWLLQDVSGITIFVEGDENDLRWDDNFPGWSGGNRVVYGEDWTWSAFYDQNGGILTGGPRLNNEIIRLPVYRIEPDADYVYDIIGWDVNGDGIADSIPATSVVDIEARPVISAVSRKYTVTFMDKSTGTVYHTEELPYGAKITCPSAPTKKGHTFNFWNGYTEGMTVAGNTVIYADWTHTEGGHKYGEAVWVDATCTQPGYYKHECSVCGEYYRTGVTEALGHDYTDSVVPPTCTERGYTLHTCSACGHSYKDTFLPAVGHVYGDWITDTPATCIKEGSCYRECVNCDLVEHSTVPVAPHSFKVVGVIEPTCHSNGKVSYLCEVCGATAEDTVAKTSHEHEKKPAQKHWLKALLTKNPDILVSYGDDEGYYYQCAECNDIRTVEESAGVSTGGGASVQSSLCKHDLADWTEYIAPNCTDYGIEARLCTKCEKPIEIRLGAAPNGGHVVTAWNITHTPACTEKGERTGVCNSCGQMVTEVIPATGHSFTNYVSDGNATCTEDGTKTAVCDNGCGTKNTVADIGSAGHKYTSKVTPPTCTEQGYTTHTCVCGDSYVDTYVDATGHSFGDWFVTVKPTCTEKGEEKRECANCECFETRAVDKVAHTYVDTVTPPTCTEQGYTTHTCSCGDSYVDTYTEATGHSFTNYVSDGNATLEADGTKTAVCDNGCGEKDTVTDEGSKLEFNDITSDIYEVKDGFISGISIKTTVESLKNAVNETGYVRVVKDGKIVEDKAVLATGMKVQLMNGNEVLKEITVVVTGDTNGDGNISVTDMISVKAHILKKSTLTDAYSEAGDTNGDGSISITDFIQIKAHILGKSSLEKSTVKTYAAVKYNAAPAEAEEEIKPEHVSENACCVCIADFLVPAKFVFTTGTETIKRSF